jgi:hypothetical protein
MEIELPDGTVLDAPDGLNPAQVKALVQNYQIRNRPGPTKAAAATMDQQQAQMLRGQGAQGTVFERPPVLDPNANADSIREIKNAPLDQTLGALGNFADAAMLGGADETLAGLYALSGKDFTAELARLEQKRRDYNAVNSTQGGVATGAGIIASPANLVGGEFIASAPSAVGRSLRAGGIGGGAGGAGGFLSTEGGLPERATGGAIGAGLGGTVGLVGQPAMELLGLGLKKTGEAGLGVASTIQNQMTARANPQLQAEKLLARSLLDDGRQLGYGPAPIDAPLPGQGVVNLGGSNVSSLARQANLAPGPTRARAVEFFEEQASGASDRAADAMSGMSKKGYYGTVEALDAQKKATADPLYKEAYAGNKNVASPLIDKILATPAGRQALGDAATMMQNDMSLMGMPDSELTGLVNELVALGKMEAPNTGRGVASGLKLQSLDYVKRALDGQYESLARAGKKTEAGIILNLKKSLVSELDRIDQATTGGAYAKARGAWSGPSHALEQVEKGREFYKLRGKPADSIREFKAMSAEDRDLVRIGFVRDAIEDIGNVGDNGSVYLKLFGNQNKRAVMETMFPDFKSFKKFADQMQAEKEMLAVNRKVTGGSPTAPILAENAAYDSASNALGVVEALGSRNPLRILSVALDKARNLQRGVTPEVSEALGNLLFQMDPIEVQKILARVGAVGAPAPLSALKPGATQFLRRTPFAPLVGYGSGQAGAAIATPAAGR